jgi:hypothetical protein
LAFAWWIRANVREPISVPVSPPNREHYGRATYYLRPEQIAWAQEAARSIAGNGSVSASDLARVGLDLAAALPPDELRRLVVEQAATDGLRFPGRFNRGMPKMS